MRRWSGGLLAALALSFVVSPMLRAEDAKTEEKKGEEKKAEDKWTGEVGKTDDGVATLKVGDVIYLLKASEKATPAAKGLLTKIGKGELPAGTYDVKGALGEDQGKKWITVDLIRKSGEKKEGEKHGEKKGGEKKEGSEK